MSNEEVVECCGQCQYYLPNKDKHGAEGQCHFEPPKVFTLPAKKFDGTMQVGLHSIFPAVTETSWCGCWEPQRFLLTKEEPEQ